jgi:hypothetical protein
MFVFKLAMNPPLNHTHGQAQFLLLPCLALSQKEGVGSFNLVPRVGKQLAKFREQKKKKTEKKNPFG